MAKIRVHDLAKELGMESKELVDILKSKNIEAKSQSTLDDDVAAQIRKEAAGRKEGRSRSEKEESRVRSASAEFQEQQPYPGQTAGTAPGTFRTGKRKDSR